MKILAVMVSLISFSALAFNDFECRFRTLDRDEVRIEIERSFGPTKRIYVEVITDDDIDTYTYFTQARFDRNSGRIDYRGAGVEMEIDLWPDRQPRFGMTYRSRFRAFDVDRGNYQFGFNCRYTGY